MAKEYDYTIDYNEQMLNYYPEVIKGIREFQLLIKTQSLQINEIHEKLEELLNDALIDTAGEYRITAWEKFLGITPPQQGDQEYENWLISRRDTILSKLYPTEKLNTKAIEDIVRIFTNGIAESWLLDGTLYVKVHPSETNKSFDFDSVISALEPKCPAHLNLVVYKNYTTWDQVYNNGNDSWNDVYTKFNSWNELINGNPNVNIFEYIVDEDGNYITDEFNNRLFN